MEEERKEREEVKRTGCDYHSDDTLPVDTAIDANSRPRPHPSARLGLRLGIDLELGGGVVAPICGIGIDGIGTSPERVAGEGLGIVYCWHCVFLVGERKG